MASLQSSFENEAFSLPSGMLRDDENDHHHLNQLNHVNHHGMDEGNNLAVLGSSDFAQHLQNIPKSLMPTTHTPPPNLPPPLGGTSISSSLTETARSFSRNSHSPAMSDSGVSMDAGSGGSGSNTPQVNLAQLAKMGTLSLNSQGELM